MIERRAGRCLRVSDKSKSLSVFGLRPKPSNLQRGIKRWVRFACESNGVSELAQAIIVEWNPRFTRKMGDARYNQFTYLAKIRLSLPLWPRASQKERQETVIHEACHIIAAYKHGPFIRNHGAEWREAMRTAA